MPQMHEWSIEEVSTVWWCLQSSQRKETQNWMFMNEYVSSKKCKDKEDKNNS